MYVKFNRAGIHQNHPVMGSYEVIAVLSRGNFPSDLSLLFLNILYSNSFNFFVHG